MTFMNLTAVACLGVAAFAQAVEFDYNRPANFNAYKTYQWVDYTPVLPGDQLLDQDIKHAVDEQLGVKGLRVSRVAVICISLIRHRSRRRSSLTAGLGWWSVWWGDRGDTRVTSSTIDIGKLVIGLFDPVSRQLVWRGAAAKTLDIKKDPDKNYRNLEKAMARLFRNYPPVRVRVRLHAGEAACATMAAQQIAKRQAAGERARADHADKRCGRRCSRSMASTIIAAALSMPICELIIMLYRCGSFQSCPK